MKKVAIFAFRGEAMCFVHVLLNAIDLKENGHDVKVIIEGSAVTQVKELAAEGAPFANLWKKVKEAGLIDCVCKACAAKMNVTEFVKEQNLPLCDSMSGHPPVSMYYAQGYDVLTL